MFSRAESVYDVLLHYYVRSTRGLLADEDVNLVVKPETEMFLPEGRLGTFISQCNAHADEPRLALFLRFFGISALSPKTSPSPSPSPSPLGVQTFCWMINILVMVRAAPEQRLRGSYCNPVVIAIRRTKSAGAIDSRLLNL
jgi:hypothetical protein